MDTTSDRLEARLTDDPVHRGQLAARIEGFAARHALPDTLAVALSLCLDELIANAITHGGARSICVSATKDGLALHARIEDDGIAFDPFSDAPPPPLHTPIDERPPGGLGVLLVRRSVTDARYRRENGRNVIILRWAWSRA
nr:ATP-binding protein [Azospirillum soli]